jgi:hypothetical protein
MFHVDGGAMALPECSNCGAALTGPYCAACGQHAHGSARSVAVLLHDGWHVMTHIDGRFWQTIYMLLLRPGRLTQEYFAERRARYLPPVRLYLVVSLLFFALGPLGLHETGKSTAAPRAHVARAGAAAPATPDETHTSDASTHKSNESSEFNLEFADCAEIETSFKWLQAPLRRACERGAAAGNAPVRAEFVANIPKMMFVFLPLIALVMLLMYWWPRHYYVEHLVFFLHNHAAMFLLLLLLQPLSWAVTALPRLETADRFLKFAACVYAVWYLYRAMRVYYRQGRWLTVTKFVVVGITYAVFLSITLVTTLVVSALIA